MNQLEMLEALRTWEKPSVCFEAMRRENALSPLLSELEALLGVEQNPQHHPEGDAWTHTMLMIDSAAQVRSEMDDPLAFMLGCLCHDLGKAVCAFEDVNGEQVKAGHERLSVPLAQKMLSRLGVDAQTIALAANLCALHSHVHTCYYMNAPVEETNRLFSRATDPKALAWLGVCDTRGTGKPRESADREEAFVMARLAAYETMQGEKSL